ncbi:hypothetical protein [Chryseobacterium lathyri]|uniref:hypothetical protein n=1 Tax=Chryseobacterium lathyri TaxID=395933 RepID=UPI00278A62DF|nr:hypothetical protein [Chryseobacterium lathyri]MDQ0068152.1 hypothetical protein [Chryseobacterium lathyri]
MKKTSLLLCFLCTQLFLSQIGINTNNPKSTLDVTAKTTDGTKPEGLIAPRLSGDQIQAGDAQYTMDQKGSIIYATSPVAAASPKTINITEEGYYFFDGNIWQKISQDTNLYKNNGTLESNRVVTMADKTLSFNSSATTGTSHFQVDNTTLNIDAVNNRVGLGTTAPVTRLDIDNGNVAGAIKITDGTQAEGRVLVSDANGVGTWRDTTGSAIIVNSTTGISVNILGTLTYVGASAVVTVSGYYIVSPRLITNKTPSGCGSFIAYNLSKSATASVDPAFPSQDVHLASGAGSFDFIYTSNIAYLTPGTYYMKVRYFNGCTTNISRSTFAENSFTLTLLK